MKRREIKTKLSVHAVTYDALVYFFYLTKKLEKGLIESFATAIDESAEVRATEIIKDYFHEKRKRSIFTYRMGSELVQAKAKTSLDRAAKFHDALKGMLSELSG